jgi:FdhD protein
MMQRRSVARPATFRPMAAPVSPIRLLRHEDASTLPADDILVTEEPLEIRLGHGPLDARMELRLSVTMRTPGHDQELALGFLYTEGVIDDPGQVVRVVYCENVRPEERGNVVRVELRPEVIVDPARWQRSFYTTSSCGVCGKSSIEAVQAQCRRPLPVASPVEPTLIIRLPDRMRAAQTVFKHTGGIHAAALFSMDGELLLLREDVGRHNTVDKLVGATLDGRTRSDTILVVSGRAGFELVQKCIVAGIPVMAAVGAPSSLAVQLARENGLQLFGFVRDGRCNRYSPSPTVD